MILTTFSRAMSCKAMRPILASESLDHINLKKTSLFLNKVTTLKPQVTSKHLQATKNNQKATNIMTQNTKQKTIKVHSFIFTCITIQAKRKGGKKKKLPKDQSFQIKNKNLTYPTRSQSRSSKEKPNK